MKGLRKVIYLLTMVSVVLFASSCSSEDVDISKKENVDVKSLIPHKWVVSDASNEIRSIEFSKDGVYILIKNQTPLRNTSEEMYIYYGDYEVDTTKHNTVMLSGLGTLNILQLSDKGLDFELTLADNSKQILKTTKTDELASSTNTDLLCRTWTYVKGTENGQPISEEEDAEMKDATIIFSRAGTYFTHMPNSIDGLGGLAKWKWQAGTNEKYLEYSWGDDENGIVEVNVTKDTLTMTEVYEDEDEVTTNVTTLRPYNNVELKSAHSNMSFSTKVGKGFLRNR